MKRLLALSLATSAVFLTACGSDYDANPIVITDDEVIIISNQNPDETPVEAATLFAQEQKLRLQSSIWQTSCLGGQIAELTFNEVDRTSTLYTFDDLNCSTLTEPPTVSTDAYTVTQTVTTNAGLDANRIEFRTLVLNSIEFDRTLFLINDANVLYFGQGSSDGLLYDTSINFNTPYFSISDGQRVVFEEPQTLPSL